MFATRFLIPAVLPTACPLFMWIFWCPPRNYHEDMIEILPVTTFNADAYTTLKFGSLPSPKLPELLDRFDWVLDIGDIWEVAVQRVNRRKNKDPSSVAAGPHAIHRLLALAESDFDTSRNDRVVVFLGSVQYLSDSFGPDLEQRSETVDALRKYFSRILYTVRDIDLEGVKTMPSGLTEHYYRMWPQTLNEAMVAACTEENFKRHSVLSGFGFFWSFPDMETKDIYKHTGGTSNFIRRAQAYTVGRSKGLVAAAASRSSLSSWLATSAAKTSGVHHRLIPQACRWPIIGKSYHATDSS